MAQVAREITLLPAEQLLREFLLECSQSFPGLEIWVTGGWVRDRLLGILSSDMDLGLSNTTGKEFGTFLEKFSARPEVVSKYSRRAAELGIPDTLFTKFHIMKRNANMFKKLETAGGRLFGLEVDMVNLRKEVYDGQSRNPDMEFGTAAEDAFRRDATVNALFFHLERQEVVDLTGRGIRDLDAKIMRTPLDPRQTFMDDPLRVLRLIRIGSRLGFAIDPAAMACMRDAEIHRLLDTMITRDRVGAELFKMMRGANPEGAFQHICDANLYMPVFVRLNSPLASTLPGMFPSPATNKPLPWPVSWSQGFQILSKVLQHKSSLAKLVDNEKNVDLVWTMAAYAPLAGLRRTKPKEVVQEAESAIRCPAKLSQVLESALRNFDAIDAMVSLVAAANEQDRPPRRSTVGMAVRSWGVTWTTQVVFALLSQAVSIGNEQVARGASATEGSMVDALLRKYSLFADFVYREALFDAATQRPLLNGNDIRAVFGLQEGGKYLKSVLERLMEWQFDHADEGAEAAQAWLLSKRAELPLPQADK
ncbi:Poly A polymerase, head domain protein [Cordyceps fumosorosea ARSEF 2679]|uniref:Poly A polymerase, head domain protein n=1 Tax=Cordyceps fumosorosea (strain ARSEF 2679) TaxID=1081104 RepID=A0A162MSA2_CORFA|nr:Poly A polymerase, head domain protein [Cordyceps fumosorosea ARSEF 2679]OAA66140.1 Poly A polymerase, head domain protein [Cordyceps fumosorosea ARSEF 2679]